MKITMAASECIPFAKTGGLADVIGALPKELAASGNEVTVFLPFYSVILEDLQLLMKEEQSVTFDFAGQAQTSRIFQYEDAGVTYLFIDKPEYFGRDQLYSQEDDGERFAFFCRAVLERLLLDEEQPEVLHVHDWHTGLIPFLLTEDPRYTVLRSATKTLLTIHNLQFQGAADKTVVSGALGMDEGKTLWRGNFNALKTGIAYADVISTVSPSYRDEILTERYGEGLESLLQERADDLIGIVNGIDTTFYHPALDKAVERQYDLTTIEQKVVNKRAVQQRFGLPEKGEVPLLVMISRLSGQKGIDVLQAELPELLANEEIQFVLIGSGEEKYEHFFEELTKQFPDRAASLIGFDEKVAHLVYAGADIFLMPSHFEPCGLSQLISMQYGTVPVVNRTGGLKDTVIEYDTYLRSGNGFLSDFEKGESYLDAVRRALQLYEQPEEWLTIKQNGMRGDYSWTSSAQKYEETYRKMTGK